MIPVEEIITQQTEKLKERIEEFFCGKELSIDKAETSLKKVVDEYICELLKLYYEELDANILKDKKGRKEIGLVVERRNENRQILCSFGSVEFQRTYYSKKDGGYCYPVDAVAGLEGYERVSLGVATGLCMQARKYSYSEASKTITDGAISKQTVMNKIRLLQKKEEPEQPRLCVPVLHIDADEDHISLQDGSNTMAPLVSVYEGIDKQNKRHYCRNIRHYPFFEVSPDDIWESVLTEIETHYDLTNTKIYVHGDGGAWIEKALEWFPKATFVLDRYHYNKYKKIILACLDGKQRSSFGTRIQNAVEKEDEEKLTVIWKELLELNPDREEILNDAFVYVLNNLSAIAVYKRDEESRNGGATEPHVSHVLSERLSMKPLGWSRETLRHMVPFLGSGKFELKKKEPELMAIVQEKADAARCSKTPKPKNTLGLVNPDIAIESPALNYKVTGLFRTLKSF